MNYSPAVRLSRQPLYLKVAWGLLLALGAFPVLAPIADVVAVVRTGLPTDHMAAFVAVTGTTWAGTRSTSPGVGAYVSLLEIGYAIHELVFGLLFLVIVAIPFRRGERWAWWACWIVLIADVGYSLTFGRFDPTILRQSLIADIALPVLLLVQFRRFFGDRPAIAWLKFPDRYGTAGPTLLEAGVETASRESGVPRRTAHAGNEKGRGVSPRALFEGRGFGVEFS